MNHLTLILALVLASTNASKYLLPVHRIQQEPAEKHMSDDGRDENEIFSGERFGILPKFNQLRGWTSGTEPPYYIFNQFKPSTPDDLRMKRTDASLSIVNALDVLRQKIMLEFARRKMNESKAQIQRNRELLMKTGKRSDRSYEDASDYELGRFLRERMQPEEMRKDRPTAPSGRSDRNPTTRTNQSEFPFQT